MTCNPFTSAAAKNSTSLLRPDNIQTLDFETALDFNENAANRFNREKLNTATKDINDLLKRSDISNLSVLNEKLKQTPINRVELAEFLELSNTPIDNLQRILDNEKDRRKTLSGESDTVRGTLVDFDLVDYPRDNGPGIYKKVGCAVENLQRIVRGRCTATVSNDGSFTGVVEEDLESGAFDEGIEYKASGTSTNADGIGRIDGVISKVNDELILEGNITGIPFDDGSTVFDVNLIVSEEGAGEGASFNVVVGNNGVPIISIANPGSGYTQGDTLVIEGLNIKVSVSETASLVRPQEQLSGIDTQTIPPFATVPFIPISDFASSSFPGASNPYFFPAQNFIDLTNSLDNFFNQSYGSSITSGSCGSFNLSILFALFELFNSIGEFKAQISDLINDAWDSVKEFVASIPSLLGALEQSLKKLVDNIFNEVKQTIENIRSSVASVAHSLQTISKEIGNLENFFSKSNRQKIKNTISSIMQKMVDQFDNPILAIIEWILTRLCQLSDFISNFLRSPLDAFNAIIQNVKNTKNIFRNDSLGNIRSAAQAGAVRIDPRGLRRQAAAAADRSGRATEGAGGPRYAPAITLITDEQLAEVMQNVTEQGWPGYFTFAASVRNNNYGPKWGERIEGAGWRIVRDHVPMTFYRLKQVIEAVGGGPYQVNSAYRSEEYNITVVYDIDENDIENYKKRKLSRHILGVAVDIQGVRPGGAFDRAARAHGFTEVRSYGWGMHFGLDRQYGLGNNPRTPGQLPINEQQTPPTGDLQLPPLQ